MCYDSQASKLTAEWPAGELCEQDHDYRWGCHRARSQVICQRSQLTGVAPASQIPGLVPDHYTFLLQDKNQISESGTWKPGPDEDGIPWAELWGAEDFQVQPLYWNRRHSLQRYWQVSSLLLWLSCFSCPGWISLLTESWGLVLEGALRRSFIDPVR